MISVLIVEDDPAKAVAIRKVLGAATTSIAIDVCATSADAAGRLSRHSYELMIVDMLLPMREGEAPRPDAGVRLISDIQRHKKYKVPRHIVGLTAFDALADEHNAAFADQLWHLVRFDERSREWEEKLREKVAHIENTRFELQSQEYQTDLIILCALHRVELEAVLDLPGSWRERWMDGDDTLYHQGEFVLGDRRLSVVAAAQPEMGMPAAAAITSKAVHVFRPRWIAMAGIAAGVKGRGKFGDVLIAESCWDYGSGKLELTESGSVFRPAPSQIPIEPIMKYKAEKFRMDVAALERIRSAWPDRHRREPLEVHIGPFASGASVVADPSVVERIVSQNRKLIGIEMETYGTYCAARNATAPKPLYISIKSICDFAGQDKDDSYQAYAAFTSARAVYEFAMAHLLSA